jgi:glycosyltransferase involved in cell wall biosynthesis
VSVCHALGDTFVQAGICTADRMRMVPSGLDFEAFPSNPIETRRAVREALGIDPGADVVISVAELTKDKGHDTLIEAAAEIVAHRRDVVFLIVGPGALHDQLQQEIDRRNLNGHVRLLGARGDVPDLLVAADVFVQTSWREGLSRSLLEAMYSGLAVVATDVGATREVVQQGQTGLLISPGDTAALAAGLLELLAQPAERARLASRARAEIGATRDLDTVGEAFDALYLELATHKGMGRSQVMPATGARAERAGSVR